MEMDISTKDSINFLLVNCFIIQIVSTLLHAYAMPGIPGKFNKEVGENVEMDLIENTLFPYKNFNQTAKQVINNARSEMKDIYIFIQSPLFLFIFPAYMYSGAIFSFVFVDFTRAYVTCTIGFEELGLSAIIYGITAVLTTCIIAIHIEILSRNVMGVLILSTHLPMLMILLTWVPAPSNLWMTNLFAALLGVCEGLHAYMKNVIIVDYFHDKLVIGFCLRNVATNLGTAIQTGFSAILCVYVGIYLMIAMLFLGRISLSFGERFYHKKFQVGSET